MHSAFSPSHHDNRYARAPAAIPFDVHCMDEIIPKLFAGKLGLIRNFYHFITISQHKKNVSLLLKLEK